ncbi:MAG: dihydropteroate synthase [Thermoplasmataceae archaeon]
MEVLAVFPARNAGHHHADDGRIPVEAVIRGKMSPDELPFHAGIMGMDNGMELYAASVTAEELDHLISMIKGLEDTSGLLSSQMIGKINRKKFMPQLMGIVNATPDSFYAGSRVSPGGTALLDSMLDEKPDIIDVGGESTRPGSLPVSAEEELSRINPVIEYLSGSTSIPISVDTTKPEVLAGVLKYDVRYANDISGLANPGMADLCRENDLKYILMHIRGTSVDMQLHTKYTDAVSEIMAFFYEKVAQLVGMGLRPEQIIVDPGIGFAKTAETNMEIIRNGSSMNMGLDTLFGMSRKSFMRKISGTEPEKRLYGTIAASIFLMDKSVDILRLHDVSANREALETYSRISGY